jgi:hypothetical protein
LTGLVCKRDTEGTLHFCCVTAIVPAKASKLNVDACVLLHRSAVRSCQRAFKREGLVASECSRWSPGPSEVRRWLAACPATAPERESVELNFAALQRDAPIFQLLRSLAHGRL